MRLLAVVGSHRTGKTQLIEELLPQLEPTGPVAVIKHIHHPGLEYDRAGSDTWRAGRAGAHLVLGIAPDHAFAHWSRPVPLGTVIDRLHGASPPFAWAILEGFRDALADLPGARLILLLRCRAELDEWRQAGRPAPWLIAPAVDAGEDVTGPAVTPREEVVRRVAELAGTPG